MSIINNKRTPIITDTHFGSRGDNAILYDIQERFYLDVFWPAIDAEGSVTEILHMGDVTDRRKQINFQTLSFAKRVFFEEARKRNIKIHWLLGNHDLPYKHSLKLSSHEAFKEYENVKSYSAATVVPFNGVDTLLVPWICDENVEQVIDAVKTFSGSVVAGHFEFNGFELYRGFVNNHGMETDLFRSFPLVMSGHYHLRSSRDNIFYLGAPYEMVWSDHGSDHGFHWWTPQTHDLEFVSNPHHLFYTFIYDDKDKNASYVSELLAKITATNVQQRIVKIIVRNKTQPLWYESFTDQVMNVGAHEMQFVDDTAWNSANSEMDFESVTTHDTMTLIRQYVDGLPWSNTEMQTSVSEMLGELYQEASERAKSLTRT